MSDTRDEPQSSLWDWAGSRDDRRSVLDEAVARGTLELSQLPSPLRDCREAAHRLHVRLERALGIVDLILTDNRRRMMSSKKRKNRREIRLHHMFVGCSDEVVEAIAEVACGQRDARQVLRAYIRENRQEIRFEPDEDELDPRGAHFDLRAILSEVREMVDVAELGELGELHITWGRHGRGKKSIRLGSYDFDRRLIRVHPALDRDWVPRYFVQFIVYHELLHAIFPPQQGNKRRRVHTPEFREMEKRFPKYDLAMQWECANLQRILATR